MKALFSVLGRESESEARNLTQPVSVLRELDLKQIRLFKLTNSFLLLLVRHLLLEAMHLFLVAFCFHLLV